VARWLKIPKYFVDGATQSLGGKYGGGLDGNLDENSFGFICSTSFATKSHFRELMISL